jgi:hypothetical protein
LFIHVMVPLTLIVTFLGLKARSNMVILVGCAFADPVKITGIVAKKESVSDSMRTNLCIDFVETMNFNS